jgi:hypothetical protein
MVCEQKKKHPKNNCYSTIPCSLGVVPGAEVVEKVFLCLRCHFSGTDGAFETLMSMHCLTAAGKHQPDKMLIPYDLGGTGKTLIYDTYSKSIWGSGHGSCPSSMLQKEDEYRKQGHNFTDCQWLNFDESKPSSGMEEEIVKVLLSGGWLALRRSHEAETSHHAWPTAGKSWPMNTGDIPWVASAEDACWRRRMRAYRTFCEFVSDPSKVDPSSHVFLSDPSLKAVLQDGPAACVWWRFS